MKIFSLSLSVSLPFFRGLLAAATLPPQRFRPFAVRFFYGKQKCMLFVTNNLFNAHSQSIDGGEGEWN